MIQRVVVDGKRYYTIPGVNQSLPSVTTVLQIINKPFLQAWNQRMALDYVKDAFNNRPLLSPKSLEEKKFINDTIESAKYQSTRVRDDAATIGTRAHTFIDDNLFKTTICTDIPDDLKPIAQGFQDWKKQAGLDFIKKDTIVYSLKHKYAGAFDALARKHPGKKLVILDWKTSNQLSYDYAFQVAAYAKALEEMTGEKVHEGWVVRFDKKRSFFEAAKVQDLDHSFEVFKSALFLFEAHKKQPWLESEKDPSLINISDYTKTDFRKKN